MENDLRCNVDHPFQPQKLTPPTPVSLRWLIYFHSLTSIIDNSMPAGEIILPLMFLRFAVVRLIDCAILFCLTNI